MWARLAKQAPVQLQQGRVEFGGLEKTVLERFGSAGTDLKRVFDGGARQVYEQDYLSTPKIESSQILVRSLSCQRVKEGRGPQVLCSSSLQKNTDANRRQTEIWYMAFWKLRGSTSEFLLCPDAGSCQRVCSRGYMACLAYRHCGSIRTHCSHLRLSASGWCCSDSPLTLYDIL